MNYFHNSLKSYQKPFFFNITSLFITKLRRASGVTIRTVLKREKVELRPWLLFETLDPVLKFKNSFHHLNTLKTRLPISVAKYVLYLLLFFLVPVSKNTNTHVDMIKPATRMTIGVQTCLSCITTRTWSSAAPLGLGASGMSDLLSSRILFVIPMALKSKINLSK